MIINFHYMQYSRLGHDDLVLRHFMKILSNYDRILVYEFKNFAGN